MSTHITSNLFIDSETPIQQGHEPGILLLGTTGDAQVTIFTSISEDRAARIKVLQTLQNEVQAAIVKLMAQEFAEKWEKEHKVENDVKAEKRLEQDWGKQETPIYAVPF